MIRDIIKLPSRNVSGTLDTTVPKFTYMGGIDDIDWYGRIIDLDNLKEVSKYKTIETIGSNAIERVFMTQEPIDFKSKWLSARINIYPIFYRVINRNMNGRVDVYRYLSGTTDILDVCSCGDWNQQTIYHRIMNSYGYGPNISLDDAHYATQIVSGDDEKNLEWCADCNLMREYRDGRIDDAKLPVSFEKDLTSQVFLNELNCSDLKPLISRDFGHTLANSAAKDIRGPFEIDDHVVFSMGENYPVKWTFNKLLYLLDSSIYTDITLKVSVRGNTTETESEMISRYIGIAAKQPFEDTQKQEILVYLRKWCAMVSHPYRVIAIKLTKTWLEEIFIEVITSNGMTSYYFDLATYSLANLSFVDRLG